MTLPGIEPATSRFVAQHLNHCATAVPNYDKVSYNKTTKQQTNDKLLKIVEFRTPTPQDVRKKDSKVLKLPTFAIVLH